MFLMYNAEAQEEAQKMELVDSNLLDSIFKYVYNALVYVDRESRILRMNGRACQLLNTNCQEAYMKKSIEVFSGSKLLEVMDLNVVHENNEIEINGHMCLTSRIPISCEGKIVGALAIFDDKTQYNFIDGERLKHKNENTILNMILELAYDGILVVDNRGHITKISDAYKKFLGLNEIDVIGKHVTEVIENTRMHIVAKTGIPEINDVQELKGNYIVVTRIPYYADGKIAGVIGKVLFRNVDELNDISKKFEFIEQELHNFKREVIQAHCTKYNLNTIITKTKEIIELKKNTLKIAHSNSNVTILGESGTGKELFAHAIHANSERKNAPFVKVNCAAIPDNLLESELFGYEKGAFTGAQSDKMGKFELADGGTLFLDEIGDMPLQMQAKILRVLQEGEVERLGSYRPKMVDVRIVAATHRNLKQMILDKTFREDLYYRINVLRLQIPPLRQRREDILIISDDIIDELNRSIHKNVKGITSQAANLLLAYDWPGNVRELRNIIERAYHILEGEDYIAPYHLSNNITKKTYQGDMIPLKQLIEETEKKIVTDRLIAFNGNKTKAAKDLGISRMALHNKIEKYKL